MANFNTPYMTEREGQMEFFDNYGIPYNDDASILIDNTDGVYNGCILEFKLSVNNLNKVLLQAIKYLSRMRIKGESVPAMILLIDLNATTVYVYRSEDYFDDIHKVYTGAASKDNNAFTAGKYIAAYNFSNDTDSAAVKKVLKGRKRDPEEMYLPVDVDENCIVGWAERYYRELPKASKGDFLGDDTGTAVKVTGEIRDPRHFKGLINPYTGATNEKFKYLMDCLNDRLSKKDLGAFYTPIPYAKKAAELVQMAVDRVPEGNDYIILDRCAGTGNLEAALIGLYDRNGDELVEHCVVSTYEYYEYKVLMERIGDKVRDVIPPTEANVIYENGKISNADAMSEEYINNPIIRQYVDNPKCTIILFENPPYHSSSAATYNDGDSSRKVKTNRKEMFVTQAFIQDITKFKGAQNASQELSNLFIWSGLKYYLRHDTDSYIVFSPVKYFKSIGIVNKEFLGGFAFNRNHFHASPSLISCICWSNAGSTNDTIILRAWDIDVETNELIDTKEDIVVRKVYKTIVDSLKNNTDPTDVQTDVVCNSDGYPESYIQEKGRKPLFNENIIAYANINAFPIQAINRNLVRCNWKPGIQKSQGYFVRKDDYLMFLPLFNAKLFPEENWYEKEVYYTTSDGGDAYTHDPQFLKSCLIYTCLSNQNKCLSFDGSDGRRYQNELCFEEKALAYTDLMKYSQSPATALDADEKELIILWEKILAEAKLTAGYNPEFNYGVYQITKELNTYKDVGSGKAKKRVYDYPELNGDLETLRVKLKEYYKSHITEKMFEYELLK